jgi:hypothetical protein
VVFRVIALVAAVAVPATATAAIPTLTPSSVERGQTLLIKGSARRLRRRRHGFHHLEGVRTSP